MMQHAKKMLALLIAIGIPVVVFWGWSNYQAEPTRSPANAGTVVSQEQDPRAWSRRVAARKNLNDANAITETFKESSDCLLYHVARQELKAILKDERLDDLSNETLTTLENLDATSSKYLSIVRETEALCVGSDRQALAELYADALLKSALLGNADAQSCFVLNPPLETTSGQSLESFEDSYLKYAPLFTHNALERGDPYVAARALYRYVASPGAHPSRLDDMQRADPYMTWRAARLASLRALPEQRVRLETRLALFQEQNLLRPDQIDRADAWAKATYEREFAGKPPINLDSHTPCYSSPDLAP